VTAWHIVLLASIACAVIKLVGYAIPPAVLEKPAPARIANLLTVALLSALIAVQTLARDTDVVVDARVPALLVAALLYAARVPFILVVIASAATAAAIRALA
jgi:hypothetical protein